MKITEICPTISYEINEALNPVQRLPRDSDPPVITNVRLADGTVWLSGHFRKRMATRPEELGFDPKDAIQLFKSGLELYKRDWEELPINTKFVVRRQGPARETLGIVIIKQEQPDDSIRYILNTVHPALDYSIRQTIFQV